MANKNISVLPLQYARANCNHQDQVGQSQKVKRRKRLCTSKREDSKLIAHLFLMCNFLAAACVCNLQLHFLSRHHSVENPTSQKQKWERREMRLSRFTAFFAALISKSLTPVAKVQAIIKRRERVYIIIISNSPTQFLRVSLAPPALSYAERRMIFQTGGRQA